MENFRFLKNFSLSIKSDTVNDTVSDTSKKEILEIIISLKIYMYQLALI